MNINSLIDQLADKAIDRLNKTDFDLIDVSCHMAELFLADATPAEIKNIVDQLDGEQIEKANADCALTSKDATNENVALFALFDAVVCVVDRHFDEMDAKRLRDNQIILNYF